MDKERLMELAGVQIDEASIGDYEEAMSRFLDAVGKVLKVGPATNEMSALDAFEDMSEALSKRKPEGN